jgi:hypothetical protein
MRDYVIVTVVVLGALWAFDRYKFDGVTPLIFGSKRPMQVEIFRERTVHDAVDRAMSGRR